MFCKGLFREKFCVETAPALKAAMGRRRQKGLDKRRSIDITYEKIKALTKTFKTRSGGEDK